MTLVMMTAWQGEPSAQPAGEASLGEISGRIGDAACTVDSQCRTIGIGSKPCGGPERYLAWSTVRTDDVALRSAVERHNALEVKRRAAAADQMQSNCMLVPDPGAYCAPSLSASASARGERACRVRAGRTAPSAKVE